MNQYEQAALARYPGARLVGGSGPWGAIFRCGLVVEIYFAPDGETARRIAQGGCSVTKGIGWLVELSGPTRISLRGNRVRVGLDEHRILLRRALSFLEESQKLD